MFSDRATIYAAAGRGGDGVDAAALVRGAVGERRVERPAVARGEKKWKNNN